MLCCFLQHVIKLFTNFPHYCIAFFKVYLFILLVLVLICEVIFRTYRKFHLEGKPLFKDHIIRPMAYGFSSCTIGSQSTLQAKCLSEVVFNKDWSVAFEHWFTYVILIMFLATSTFWLSRMNYAMNEFDPVFMIPLLQVTTLYFKFCVFFIIL